MSATNMSTTNTSTTNNNKTSKKGLDTSKLDISKLDFNRAYSFRELNVINEYVKEQPVDIEGQLISYFELKNNKLVPISQTPIALEAVIHEISRQLGNWNAQSFKNGIVTTSQGGFNFNVSGEQQKIRAPSVAFIPEKICRSLSKDQLWSFQSKAFTPIFVAEVASIQNRSNFGIIDNRFMNDYFAAGTSVKLGWLIDPKTRRIWVYHYNNDNEVVCDDFGWKNVSGGDILQGFTLDVEAIEDIIPQRSKSDMSVDEEESENEESSEEGKQCTYCDKKFDEPHRMIVHMEKCHMEKFHVEN